MTNAVAMSNIQSANGERLVRILGQWYTQAQARALANEIKWCLLAEKLIGMLDDRENFRIEKEDPQP